MPVPFLVHIAAGGIALLSGAVAISVSKGGRLHRRSGLVFVYAMLVMSLLGAAIAVYRDSGISVIGGLVTAYLVSTALTAVRAPTQNIRRFEWFSMTFAFGTGLASLLLGTSVLGQSAHIRALNPPPAFFMFSIATLLATAGDWRMLHSNPYTGVKRITRHLWRMCYAFWIATSSFFLGQAKVFPASIRATGLVPVPLLVVTVVSLYWVWRVRGRRNLHRITLAAGRQL